MNDGAAVHAIPPGTRFRGHEHAGPHLCAVLSGGFVERDGRGWVDVGPGAVRVSGAARHDIDFAPGGAVCLLLQLDPAELPRLNAPRFVASDPWLGNLVQSLARALAAEDGFDAEDLQTELLARVVRRLGGKSGPPPPWLARVRGLAADDVAASSVTALAATAGVHRVHLARVFREHCGMSVSGFLHRVRLRRASRLLSTTTLSLAEVALSAGFADQSHMTRAIRGALGVTPGALRRRALHPFKTNDSMLS